MASACYRHNGAVEYRLTIVWATTASVEVMNELFKRWRCFHPWTCETRFFGWRNASWDEGSYYATKGVAAIATVTPFILKTNDLGEHRLVNYSSLKRDELDDAPYHAVGHPTA